MDAISQMEIEPVRQFAHDYEDVFNRGDHEALASVYADDAELIPQGDSPIVGRRAIEEFWKRSCERARAANMKRSIHPEAVESRGDLGYLRSSVILEIPSGGSRPTTITSRAVTIWRQQADGQWRISIDISNTDAAKGPSRHAYGVAVNRPES